MLTYHSNLHDSAYSIAALVLPQLQETIEQCAWDRDTMRYLGHCFVIFVGRKRWYPTEAIRTYALAKLALQNITAKHSERDALLVQRLIMKMEKRATRYKKQLEADRCLKMN